MIEVFFRDLTWAENMQKHGGSFKESEGFQLFVYNDGSMQIRIIRTNPKKDSRTNIDRIH